MVEASSMVKDCVFCGIVAGTVPAHIIWSNEFTVAFLDQAPANDGHTLVVPRKHVRNLLDATPAEAGEVMAAAAEVTKLLNERFRPAGFTLFQANEKAGWQDAFHLHIHVVPRWPSDDLVLPWSTITAEPARLAKVADRICSRDMN